MFGRYRLSGPTAGVGLAVIIALVLAGLINREHDAGRANEPAGHEQPIVSSDELAAQPEPARAEQRADEDLQAQKDMAAWAMLMFFATVVGVMLLGATLSETRKAGIAAADILTQTKRQANAAEESTKVATDTAKRQLRAYLNVKTAEIRNFAVNNSLEVSVVVGNAGQTPAREVSTWMGIVINFLDYDFPRVPDDVTLVSNVVGPGTDITIHNVHVPLSQAAFDQVTKTKTARVYAWGRIDYVDVFGERHWTRFGLSYSDGVPSGKMAPHGRGNNDAD